MKRRKVTGLILIISTFIYFIACLLAFYQNQRVTMEKEIKEALKTYSEQDSRNIKDLSKDINLRLDEKIDMKEGEKQILKFEGSFDRMEKNITNVTDNMALVEYNLTHLDDRLEVVENYYQELYVELTEKYDLYEQQFAQIDKNTVEVQNKIGEIEKQITDLENQIKENDTKQIQNTEVVQLQVDKLKETLTELIANVLLYQYDSETQTLHVYGDKGEIGKEEIESEGEVGNE